MSLSADISNRLAYEFPDRVIVVSYIQGRKVNVSIRGQRIKAKVMEIVKELKNTTGGGHESAVGIQMDLDDLNLFKAKFEKINF